MVTESDPEALLEFLKMTKEGHYAPIRQGDLKYVRLKENPYSSDLTDDDFYYGIR